MSQKQVCAIFATSFLAGLLVTAVTFQPFSSNSVTAPYFGFPGETIAVDASRTQPKPNVLPESSPSQPQNHKPSYFSNLPNELARSLNSTFGDHLLDSDETSSVTSESRR